MADEKIIFSMVGVSKTFTNQKKVLNGIYLSFFYGAKIGIIGLNGSGKSTLLNIIGGIDSADSGYISIGGDKLEEMSEKKLTQYRRKHLGYVFQM